MLYSSYKNIGTVAKEFQIKYIRDNFIIETEFPISEFFRQELELVFNEGVVDNSESAICENIIYPILKEVWKAYRSNFLLWSHQALNYDQINDKCGVPDYVLAKRSPLGSVVFDKPYFVLVKAKKESDFSEGWGQCLAEMIAVQRLNQILEQTIFGIVSNGLIWQFGKLNIDIFTQNKIFYTIQELDKLFAAINYVFGQCELQLNDREQGIGNRE